MDGDRVDMNTGGIATVPNHDRQVRRVAAGVLILAWTLLLKLGLLAVAHFALSASPSA